MYKLGLAAIFITLPFFLSCSDNSSDSGDLEIDGGVGSYQVTGNLEVDFEGAAYFTVLKNNGNLLGVRIHIVDAHPLDRDDSYDPQYSFMLMSDLGGDPISLSTGTYDIGSLSDDKLMFAGVYTHRANRANSDVVNGYQHQNGSITITSYSDELIEASFDLTSINNNAEEDEIISISGDFSAKCYGPNC